MINLIDLKILPINYLSFFLISIVSCILNKLHKIEFCKQDSQYDRLKNLSAKYNSK